MAVSMRHRQKKELQPFRSAMRMVMQGYVLIHGKKAPICGRVCMDQFMVDVTEIPEAKEGDPVTLLGKDGSECITMEELGELSGRFNYEFACLITPRVPRICIQES